jgi:hypothetical protein
VYLSVWLIYNSFTLDWCYYLKIFPQIIRVAWFKILLVFSSFFCRKLSKIAKNVIITLTQVPRRKDLDSSFLILYLKTWSKQTQLFLQTKEPGFEYCILEWRTGAYSTGLSILWKQHSWKEERRSWCLRTSNYFFEMQNALFEFVLICEI